MGAPRSPRATGSAKPEPPPIGWESPTSRVPGLGATAARALADIGVTTVADLVWLLPASYDDLRAPLSVDDAVRRVLAVGEARCAVVGVVESLSIIPGRGRRGRSIRLVLAGSEARLVASWFFFAHAVVKGATKGATVLLVGKATSDGKPLRGAPAARMVHPDLIVSATVPVRPRYPRFGVPAATLRRVVPELARTLRPLPDPVPHDIAVREGMPPIEALLLAAHAPAPEDGPPSATTLRRLRERLAWVEVMTRTLDRLAVEEAGERGAAAPALPVRPDVAAIERAFGFPLTASQRRALGEIGSDLARSTPMRRLLLGDVGTGKTVVALSAALQSIQNGCTAALLAPTTVLAEQYADAAAPLARAFGVRFEVLTGAATPKARRELLARVTAGQLDFVVGTHALLSGDVTLPRLGVVVVDEQQRLGVAQRLALVRKGARPHLLTLSATPIPRTLALALRGDLPMSSLDERPASRPPVTSELLAEGQGAELHARIGDALARGEQVFVVCPRIYERDEDEEDEGSDAPPLPTAVTRAAELAAAFPKARIVLVHGALRPDDKVAAMRAFRGGEADVLVGTTVVEVGVDVPGATLMVVLGAERFGLAQLHQLRGRVGRGSRPGHAVFVHGSDVAPPDRAHERLTALVRTSRGEDVARLDLELRGAGDMWGTRQSGDEEGFAYLDETESPPWLGRIPEDARRIFATDRELARPEHRALGLLVRRFRRALAVREEAG